VTAASQLLVPTVELPSIWTTTDSPVLPSVETESLDVTVQLQCLETIIFINVQYNIVHVCMYIKYKTSQWNAMYTDTTEVTALFLSKLLFISFKIAINFKVNECKIQ